MVNTRFEMNRADFIFIRQMPVEGFRLTHLGCMTCMAIYGNGVPTTGWMIILPLPEMAVLIKTKAAGIVLHAAVRGMNHPRFAEAQRGSRFWKQTPTSLWGFE